MDSRLMSALFTGAYETPLWQSFLELLRQITGADYCVLNFQPPGRPFADGQRVMAGGPVWQLEQNYLQHFTQSDQLPGADMPEGKPFSLEEAASTLTPDGAERVCAYLDRHGIGAARVMRVRESSGLDAILTISRKAGGFTRVDERLLVEIAPILRGVFQLYIASERDRFAAALTAQAVRSLQFGWLALDGNGHILECDELGATILSTSGVLSRGAAGRLVVRPAELGREIAIGLREMAADPTSRPRALTLRREPWLDMMLIADRRKRLTARSQICAIAYVHADNWSSSDRHEQLGELFGLSPREARLALAISRGMTIAEAAAYFVWTEATARTYARSIYAKTGARGQADLVRIIHRSVLAIAPATHGSRIAGGRGDVKSGG